MSDDNLIQVRKDKIQLWEELGFEGYARKFDRTHTSDEATKAIDAKKVRDAADVMKKVNASVSLCGRIMNVREMGKLAFLKIRDVSGDFQICLAQDVLGEDYKKLLKALDLGDFVGFGGEFFLTKHGEPTLMASEVTPLGKSLRPLPEKWKGLQDREACYRERNLDLISNPETFERFQIRSRVIKEIREFFWEKDFEEVETRVLQPQAGGAMAKVFETHHNALDHEFVLRIALELDLKMACSGGFERIFEIGKNFRNEGTDPSHLQEFTMLEWYAAYKDIETNMQWTEELIHRICDNVLETTKVTVLDKDDKPVEIDFSGKFAVARFPDLLKEHAGIDMMTISDGDLRKEAEKLGIEDVETTGRANLLDDVYKKTARPKLIQPTFVLDYPEDLKPLARPNGDGTASCFQLLIAGWEVVNSYGELINPEVQRELFERQSAAKAAGDEEAMEVDEEFLKAMEHGFPPMTGSGIGIDRLVALLTGQPNLRDVVLFPTMKPEHQKKDTTTNLSAAIINTAAISEDWQALNAVAHLSAAFGARNGKQLFYADEIETKDKQKIKLNTTHAIMIKQTDSNDKLIELLQKAKEAGLHVAEFTHEMIATSDDQKVMDLTREKNLKDVQFLGGLVYGKKSVIESLTKDYPLFSGLSERSSDNVAVENKAQDNTHETLDGDLTRDKAWKMVQSRCDFALQRHLAHVAASMEALANHFNADNVDDWYIAGLLHDIDWNQTIEDPDQHCGPATMQYLSDNGASEEIISTIRAHYTETGEPMNTQMKQALFACDELSGFAVAVALMRPTKMMGISPKSITKKMKDKKFAEAVSRDDMKSCEEFFDMPVNEFLQILIPAWEAIAGDWELKA